MQLFWIEGVLIPKGGKKSGMKPYSDSFWAISAQEAMQLALSTNPGARWVEGPTVSEISEEKRMRALGAPELPGLDTVLPGPVKKTSKK
jgi:hypothetical protein